MALTGPPNLVVAPKADRDLAAASIHAWKTDLLTAQEAALDAELPDASLEERKWGQCMMLSRALMHQRGVGGETKTVMMPFFDLLNHGYSGFHQSFPDRAVAVAATDMKAGDEITFPYVESPSKARLLTSFGFAEGAPSASLAANDLPQRDRQWLAENGCSGTARTDLYVNSKGKLTNAALRQALRCIRLRLYTPEEAQWSLDSGHIDGTWDGPVISDGQRLLKGCVEKDVRVVGSTGMMCSNTQSEELLRRQASLLSSASPELSSAVEEETRALMGCAQLLQTAYAKLLARLGETPPQ